MPTQELETELKQEKIGIHVGAIVTVAGYGGRAKVVSMEQDGVTPQGRPKYLCSVVFGPYSNGIGRSTQPCGTRSRGSVGRTLKYSQGPVHEFYSGKLTNVLDEDTTESNKAAQQQAMDERIDTMDAAALRARLAEINAKLGA